MWNVSEDLKDSAVAFVHVAEQHRPAKPAVQNHEHRGQNRRRAIAQKLLPKAMQHAYQRHADDVVLNEKRIAQTGARAHEHRRNEVGEKWISEAYARERGIFGREV